MKTSIFYIAVAFTIFVVLRLIWGMFALSPIDVLLCLVYLSHVLPILTEHKYFEEPRNEFLTWLDNN
jgi:hypothetical protein